MTSSGDLKTTEVVEKQSERVNIDYINWKGFERVPEYSAENEHGDEIYQQYRWPISNIEIEKERVKKMNEMRTEINNLKQTQEKQSSLINTYKSNLEELQKQKLELDKVRSAVKRAKRYFVSTSRQKREIASDVRQIIENMPCGATIGEFIDNYKFPDEIKYTTSNGYASGILSSVKLYWGEFLIDIDYDYIRDSITKSSWHEFNIYSTETMNEIRNYRISTIYSNYGVTSRGWRICKQPQE